MCTRYTYCFIKLVVGHTLAALLLCVMSRKACCHAYGITKSTIIRSEKSSKRKALS